MRLSRIRLLPRVFDSKPLLRPGVEDARFGERMIPMMPITSSGMPNSIRVSKAPSPADGKR